MTQELAKSRKLAAEEAGAEATVPIDIPTYQREDVIRIRPIETLNEFLLVMPFALDTHILLPSQMQFQPYGIVVGVSKSIMAPDGSRTASALRPGDVIRFWERNVIDHDYKTPDPHYVNRRLVLISERSALTRLPPVRFEIITEPAPIVGGPRQLATPERKDEDEKCQEAG
jgi:hypothetical protein